MDQVKNCNVLKDIARNAQHISKLQNQKLTEEQKLFRWGRSDTDTIIRFQQDLILDQRSAILRNNSYYKSIVNSTMQEGTLLKKYWDAEF